MHLEEGVSTPTRIVVLGTIAVLLASGGNGAVPAVAQTPPPAFDHIFVVVEENKSYSEIIGSPQAPYINGLVGQNGVATQYSAVAHPSLPNYLALTGGSTFGITTDCSLSSCPVNAFNIADRIEGAGRTWKAYMEAMPAPCGTSDSSTYATRHNPFIYYNDIRNDPTRCANHVVPYSSLAADLASTSTTPSYAWITPDVCNDMHDCGVSVGDTWLKNNLPAILSSPAWTTQRSLLLLTWDEGTTPNDVATLMIGPSVVPGYQSPTAYSHYSLLNTVESAWGLSPLTSNDGNATPMTDFFAGSVRVAAVGADGGLWVGPGSGPGFSSLGGTLLAAPAVATVPSANGAAPMPLFVGLGSDHALWVRTYNLPWQPLGAAFTYCLDSPAAVVTGSPGSSILTVACQGPDHALYASSSSVASGYLPTVGAWTWLGGNLTAGPAIAAVNGVTTFFVTGGDQHIYSRTFNNGYVQMPYLCVGHPALATAGSNSYFACQGGDGALWYAVNSGSGWPSASSAGGLLIDGPGLAATSDGATFFVEGSDHAVWQRSITPSGALASAWTGNSGYVHPGAGATALP
jgi:hypothetical protein